MFIGRTREIQRLQERPWREKATLTVVYGRRRVGKTALIEQAYRDDTLWKFEGIEGESRKVQIKACLDSLSRETKRSYSSHQYTDWQALFNQLEEEISAKLESLNGKPLILLFDEFQWLAQMKSTLVSLFKSFWDNVLSKHNKLIVVLCGSVSSFMVRKVIRSTALYGRISRELLIRPLPSTDIRHFFKGQLLEREVLDLAMCFGGIPKYLEEYDPRLSLMQNFQENVLNPEGFFFREYDRIFISHFGKNPLYEKIIRTLCKNNLSAGEIANSCQTTTGGTLTQILEELQLAGFIERYTPINKQSKNARAVRFRILDEYMYLYFQLIEHSLEEIESGRFQPQVLLTQSRFKQWRGYAFERLCRRNAHLIADTLKFSGINYRVGSWFSQRDSDLAGTQIDLMFNRQDKVITLCEAKYTEKLQGRSIEQNMEQKVSVLRKYFPQYAIEKVLIVAGQAQIPLNLKKYFDHILCAEQVFI